MRLRKGPIEQWMDGIVAAAAGAALGLQQSQRAREAAEGNRLREAEYLARQAELQHRADGRGPAA